MMGWGVGLVRGPVGGKEGVSMSMVGCNDRGVDPCWNLQHFVGLSY